ncbi:TPA: uridine kinase [Candidatus Latescibacteria bacterium]|nr:uridine kinase [Candidatus Latescibacterota bacterium]
MSVLIAVSGATASGKSTFSRALCKAIGDLDPVLVVQDRYFRDFHDVPEPERKAAVTSNHPMAVLWDDLVDHLGILKQGGTVTVPVEGTRFKARGGELEVIGPSDVVIVEGHLLFTDPRVVELADLSLFIDANVHERVVRRLLRDTSSGKTSLEGATTWYRRDVIPNVSRYSEPGRTIADMIIPWDEENGTAVTAVAEWLRGRQ